MNVIEKLLDTTKKLDSLLSEIPDENNRDIFIQQVEELLETREHDLQGIQILSKDELREHYLAPALIKLDLQIKKQLDRVMSIIKKDIRDFQIKRKSDVSYSNPYAATQSIDGKYYDRKK